MSNSTTFTKKELPIEVLKINTDLGIVFGYAMICKIDGDEYVDVQNDHIPEQAMLEATAEYMKGDRIAKAMHVGEACGQVVFGFPLTTDIAKALDITVVKTGFIVGIKPDNDEILEKFIDGTYTGFSIGGTRVLQTGKGD